MNRELLGALADELIPAGSGMPSASGAGVAGEYLDAVLAARPDLAAPLERALPLPLRCDSASSAVSVPESAST